MRKINIPKPEIQNYMEQFQECAEFVDSIQESLNTFFGQEVSVYYQGEFTADKVRQLKKAENELLKGKWTLRGNLMDLKNIVFILNNDKISMNCNFSKSFPDVAFLRMQEFKNMNSNIVFKFSKNRKSLICFFKENDKGVLNGSV